MLANLFARRSAAALSRDAAAWVATVDPAATGYLERQKRAAGVLAELPLQDWTYELLDDDGARVRVRLRYRLQGYDRADLVRTQVWSVTSALPLSVSSLRVADDRASDPDVWDLSGSAAVTVVSGKASLVIGELPVPTLEAYAAQADAATVQVTSIWGGDWPQRVVVVAPQRTSDAARLLGMAGAQTLDGTAALTTGQLRGADAVGSGATSGDRIVLTPGVYDGLTAVGKHVVLTHEVTHVATRASTRTFPPSWLAEGFADYVGFLGAKVPVAVAAQELFAEIRDGRLPDRLPSDGAFSPVGKETASAYEQAWLACQLIARRHGRAVLVRLYRRVGAGASLSVAFRAELRSTPSAFLASWRAFLLAQTR